MAAVSVHTRPTREQTSQHCSMEMGFKNPYTELRSYGQLMNGGEGETVFIKGLVPVRSTGLHWRSTQMWKGKVSVRRHGRSGREM